MIIQKIFKNYYTYIFLIILLIIGSLASPYFMQVAVMMNIVVLSVTLLMLSLGQNLVILTGKFDLSVGSILALSTVIASVIMKDNIFLSIFVPIIIGLIIGVINGIGVSKFKIDSFIMTYGMMVIVMGITLIIRLSPGGYINPGYINFLLYKIGPISLTPIILLILTLFTGEFVLKRTNFGRNIYAVGNDEKKAIRAGINVTLVRTAVFAISGVTASLGGLFLSAVIASGDSTIGDSYLFDSITAVVLGGTSLSGGRGDFKGTMGAVLILSTLGRVFNMIGVGIWYTYLIKGILLVIVIAIGSFFGEERGLINDKA